MGRKGSDRAIIFTVFYKRRRSGSAESDSGGSWITKRREGRMPDGCASLGSLALIVDGTKCIFLFGHFKNCVLEKMEKQIRKETN